MDQRVSLVTLGVADTKRAREFYEALGWKGTSPDGDVVFFQCGGIVFSVWGREDLAKDSEVKNQDGWGGITLAHNVGSNAEVDAVIAQALKAGATIAREPAGTFYGGYAGVFHDPDGHPWEISHNPGFPLADDGSIVLPHFDH